MAAIHPLLTTLTPSELKKELKTVSKSIKTDDFGLFPI